MQESSNKSIENRTVYSSILFNRIVLGLFIESQSQSDRKEEKIIFDVSLISWNIPKVFQTIRKMFLKCP